MTSRTLLLLCALIVSPVSGLSATAEAAGGSNWFYLFVSPCGAFGGGEETENYLYLGPGFGKAMTERLSLDASVGYLAHMKTVNEAAGDVVSLSGFGEDWFWVCSLNATCRFSGREGVKEGAFFGSVGYALYIRDAHRHLWNVGVGHLYTFNQHWGVRVELRDSVMRTGGAFRHFVEFRIGLALH